MLREVFLLDNSHDIFDLSETIKALLHDLILNVNLSVVASWPGRAHS